MRNGIVVNAARLLWIVVAVVGGSAVDGAVSERSDGVRWVAGIGSWTLWGAVMLSLAIPSVKTLTLARVLAPLSLPAAIAAPFFGATAFESVRLGAPAILAVVALYSADFGRHFIQASSYGDEERLPLRIPVAAGTAAVVAWALWAPMLVAGPLLLGARSWIGGAVVSIAAVVLFLLLIPRWHRLSQRWLVLVPAGLVLHDPVVLADTLMLRTEQIGSLQLASAGTEAADLTGPASGYAIEITATETVTTVFAFTPKEPNGRAIHLTGFLVSPSRPGEALRTAAARGLRVS